MVVLVEKSPLEVSEWLARAGALGKSRIATKVKLVRNRMLIELFLIEGILINNKT